jgi:hypothetical protein
MPQRPEALPRMLPDDAKTRYFLCFLDLNTRSGKRRQGGSREPAVRGTQEMATPGVRGGSSTPKPTGDGGWAFNLQRRRAVDLLPVVDLLLAFRLPISFLSFCVHISSASVGTTGAMYKLSPDGTYSSVCDLNGARALKPRCAPSIGGREGRRRRHGLRRGGWDATRDPTWWAACLSSPTPGVRRKRKAPQEEE